MCLQTVDFKVDMTSGSGVTVQVDYGDGSAIDTIVTRGGDWEASPPTEVTFSHTFNDGGNYKVNVSIKSVF